jgi:hypothetical protein
MAATGSTATVSGGKPANSVVVISTQRRRGKGRTLLSVAGEVLMVAWSVT